MFYTCHPSHCVFISHVPQAYIGKTGEIYVLFLSNVFLRGRVWAAEWFRIWGRETLGSLGTHSNVSTGLWWCCRGVVSTVRPAKNSEFTSYFDIDFKCDVQICSFPAELDTLTLFIGFLNCLVECFRWCPSRIRLVAHVACLWRSFQR